ncbi:terminase small subunit [Luteolibacter sp. GHJ8]|uniref:Terminase small subunit n=1 Tax=Luteolibacter rhizosphaerae TaxID=2989719 RepID=A0ABT3GA50_9BACT|nr:terminase small subunit [Luteolibacter rhizosphaerae]MCW1916349.1 terminase small subunit [Luteolibacter rhizosphaerae]
MDQNSDTAAATDPAAKKLNPRQIQFAHLVGTGTTQREAYRIVYGSINDGNAHKAALRPNVAAAIARHQQQAAATCTLKRDDLIRTLTDIILTPVADLHIAHPLTAEYTVTRTAKTETTRIKALSKMDAIKLLAQLCGWLKPEPQPEPVEIVLKKMW